MFTGIVRALGTVGDIVAREGDVRLTIESPGLDLSRYETGESICVSGVCLTAVELERDRFFADVSRETLSVTTLGERSAGDRVNLEPSLALGERLGGHLVMGHVDAVGRLRARQADARSVRLEFALPAALARYVARKGSIAVDGVSLTVNETDGERFTVNIIPHTAEVTTLGALVPGDRVNLEIDMMARYAERLLAGENAGNGDDSDMQTPERAGRHE